MAYYVEILDPTRGMLCSRERRKYNMGGGGGDVTFVEHMVLKTYDLSFQLDFYSEKVQERFTVESIRKR